MDESTPQIPSPETENAALEGESQSILVIGGSGSLGGAVCEAFARKGARIAVHYHSGEERALKVAAVAASRGAVAMPIAADLTEGRAACHRLIDRIIEDFGRLDVVVFAAKAGTGAPLPGMAEADWDHAIAANLTSAAWCAQAAFPHLRKSRPAGHFVVVGSYSAFHGSPEQANCIAALAGAEGLVRGLAREWGLLKTRVCVNGIIPPLPDTPPSPDATPSPDYAQALGSCLQYTPTPEDVARFIVHLTSHRGISGQVLHVDSRI